jgi:hypothetical protein
MGRHPSHATGRAPRRPAAKTRTPPPPGRETAPDATTQGVDSRVIPRGEELDRVETSAVGPGAGETELVRVTTRRDVDEEDVAHHPSFRRTPSAPDRQSAHDK